MKIAPIWGKALMRRQIFDSERHACFVTFSCLRRRKLLDDKQAKGIVVHFLSVQLKNQKFDFRLVRADGDFVEFSTYSGKKYEPLLGTYSSEGYSMVETT